MTQHKPTQNGVLAALRDLGDAASPLALLNAVGLEEADDQEALVVHFERSLAELEYQGRIGYVYDHWIIHGSELDDYDDE